MQSKFVKIDRKMNASHHLNTRLFHVAYRVIGVVLIATAIAKIAALFGDAKLLLMDDPITGLQYRKLLTMATFLEVVVGAICILGKHSSLKSASTLWLASVFIIYRVGTLLNPYHGTECPCLGSLTEVLGISTGTANKLLLGIVVLMVVTGVAHLIICSTSKGTAGERLVKYNAR